MGLSRYSSKLSQCWVYQDTQIIQLTVVFIGFSSKGSNMAKCTSRHNQSNTPLVVWGCTESGSYMAKIQNKKQPSQHIVRFITFPIQSNIWMGLSGWPAKPIYHWVYQAIGQANIRLGLSGCPTKPIYHWVYQVVNQFNLHLGLSCC